MLRMFVLSLLVFASLLIGVPAKPKPVAAFAGVSVYGAWHCGNDFCTWSTVRNMTDFNTRNRWLIDRGDGSPSVNLVVLSFVHPLRLLNKTNDASTSLGIPIGMNQAVVDYFKTRGVRVQISMGGITYTDAWNQALATNPVQLGLNAPRRRNVWASVSRSTTKKTRIRISRACRRSSMLIDRFTRTTPLEAITRRA